MIAASRHQHESAQGGKLVGPLPVEVGDGVEVEIVEPHQRQAGGGPAQDRPALRRGAAEQVVQQDQSADGQHQAEHHGHVEQGVARADGYREAGEHQDLQDLEQLHRGKGQKDRADRPDQHVPPVAAEQAVDHEQPA